MSDHPKNPTLLVGLGAFGRDVLELAVRGPARRIPNLARIEARIAPAPAPAPASASASAPAPAPASAPAPAPASASASASAPASAVDGVLRLTAPAEDLPRAVLAPALESLRALLDLEHFVDHTDPTDPRGPRCDVFLIADLGEPGVAHTVAPLAAALASTLRADFKTILHGGDGTLSVCPLLSAPRAADPATLAAAVRAIAHIARAPAAVDRLQARAYLVEDQSGKYLLARPELVRSFAAFLHLLLFSGLRDDEAGARGLVERAETDQGGPFATFACATLELDHRVLARLCAVKLAREILACLRTGADPTIAEIAAAAADIVPERLRLETELWQESSAGSLEKHLEPPAIDVPPIAWSDSPEEIVERKLGALFRARAAHRIRAFREDVERFKMDRLAAEIEKSGKACLERALDTLADRVKREVAAGPRGHARALELLRDAHTRARGWKDEVEAEIESPDLAPFPDSPLDARAAAVDEAAFNRPRLYRMKIFGALAIFIAAALVSGVILGGLRAFVAPNPPFFGALASAPTGLAGAIARWPLPFAAGAVFGASSIYYRLWKHYKRHHNWVVEARDSLDQALVAYLRRDVVSYFYQRLHYTRLLWVQRIYRRLTERIEEAIENLETVRAALAQAEQKLTQDERGLDDQLAGESTRGGILFRSLIAPGDVNDIYAEVRPVNVLAAAERFLRESLATEGWTSAPFADPDALIAFCDRELSGLAQISPFKADSEALFRSASASARTFLQKLALKLSPPLSVIESAAQDALRARHIAVVPAEAEALIQSILTEENLRGAWDVRALSKDPRRVHLLIERGEIRVEALRIQVDGGGEPRGKATGERRAP